MKILAWSLYNLVSHFLNEKLVTAANIISINRKKYLPEKFMVTLLHVVIKKFIHLR